MNQPLTKEQQAAVPAISDAIASEYDHVILVDRSGSMSSPSDRYQGKSRWQEAQEYCVGFANYLGNIDEDGFTLITFNGDIKVTDNLKNADAVQKLFANEAPGGGTLLAPAIQAALNKFKQSGKPGMIHVFLDGEASDREQVAKTIIAATQTMQKDAELAISFMQVGHDQTAAKFLQQLDDDLQGKGAKFDVVNSMNISDSDSLSIQQVMYLALND